MRDAVQLRVRIAHCNRQGHAPQAVDVVDVVANEAGGIEPDPVLLQNLSESSDLVVDTLNAPDTELLTAPGNDGIRLRGYDYRHDSRRLQSPQPEAIAARAADRLAAVFENIDGVIGEDAVEIETNDPHPPDQLHELEM